MSEPSSPAPQPAIARSYITDLPNELKMRIVPFLSPREAIPLACVNSTWQELAEAQTWSSISSCSVFTWASPNDDDHLAEYREQDLSWAELLVDMQARPARIAHIKEFSLLPSLNEEGATDKVMSLIGDRLEYLYVVDTSCQHDYDSGCDCHLHNRAVDAIERTQGFPRLRAMCIEVGGDYWEDDVLRALQYTPALVDLEVKSLISTESSTRDKRFEPKLPHLKRLSVVGVRAPRLLALLGGTIERLEVEDGGPDENAMDLLDPLVDHDNIKHLDIDQIYWRRPSMSIGRDSKKGWLAGLESVSLNDVWGRCIFEHPTVRHLRLYGGEDIVPIGTYATAKFTGWLAPWTVEIMRKNPGLIQLVGDEIGEASTDGWWIEASKSIRLTTINDEAGDDSLFHVRVDMTRHRPDLLLDWHDNERLQGLKDQQLTEWARKHKAESDSDQVYAQPTHLDLTSYRGQPLPHALLREIYELNGLSPSWEEGRRDLRMSTQASEALGRWVNAQEENK